MPKNNTATTEVTEVIELPAEETPEVKTLTAEQIEAIELAVNMEVHSGPPATDVHAIVWSESMNTSQKIRALAKAGHKNAAIVKLLNPWYESENGRALRYQHVRNVLMTPTKKG